MECLVNKVEIGASYEEKIFDFWVDFQFKNGKTIKAFDYKPFDLRNFEGKTISVLLLAGYITNKETGQEIKGTITDEIFLEKEDWSDCFGGLTETKMYRFCTEHGTFLISKSEMDEDAINTGSELTLRFARIDIVAYKTGT